MTTKWIDTNGFHRKVRTWSFIVVLTQKGGDEVRHVVLHDQISMDEARKNAERDNPGFRFKGILTTSERDFEP